MHTCTLYRCHVKYFDDTDPFSFSTNYLNDENGCTYPFAMDKPLGEQIASLAQFLRAQIRVDDAALQVYYSGELGTYLDTEASLNEQLCDIEGLPDSPQNAIILRTQLSVRVHSIKEKLLTSHGSELRASLFSLKQVFNEDKDLVHEFVRNGGLECLVSVGSVSDHNYQTYILRALGQIMLYVDGMTGVSNSPQTLQWLYSLIDSKFRLVIKTALKLLIVFVEYSEYNALMLTKAIAVVDKSADQLPWGIIMHLLDGRSCPDTTLQIYAMTLVNKTLNGLPDQNSYYNQTDSLEDQGLEKLIQKSMHNPNSDLDFLQQFAIYEAVLAFEDGDDICRTRTIDPTIRQELRYSEFSHDDEGRRRSRRHYVPVENKKKNFILTDDSNKNKEESFQRKLTALNGTLPIDDLKDIKHKEAGVTPGLRRRREKMEQQSKSKQEFQEKIRNLENKRQDEKEMENNIDVSQLLKMVQSRKDTDFKGIAAEILDLLDHENSENSRKSNCRSNLVASVEDILEELNQRILSSANENEETTELENIFCVIQEKYEHLKPQMKSNSLSNHSADVQGKSDDDSYWEDLASRVTRPLQLCDLDFTDLSENDDQHVNLSNIDIKPPPPPPPPPPMFPLEQESFFIPPPPPPIKNTYDSTENGLETEDESNNSFGSHDRSQKTKRTIKLFWKEIRNASKTSEETVWNSLESIAIDRNRLEDLFESRINLSAKEKPQEQKGAKELIVLESKRSNVINIGMTKLPPPRTIKAAILKMDSSIINKEGIEKILQTMLPSDDEKRIIQEAVNSNPEIPLGSAEQFLMILSSISELPARLNLWLFKLDFEVLEKEVAEALIDLKQGMEGIIKNKTFNIILATLLSIGNFLNGTESKGFQIEYLSKVPEVKDTTHKHSLLYHLCQMIHEKYPQTSDLHSEIGPITRASKVDFDDLLHTVEKMKRDCKASFGHLKAISKHDGPNEMKFKMTEFLSDAAERIVILEIIFRRVMNRFHRFLLWLGISSNLVMETKPQKICSIISEFALEYRTCKERVLQQIQKRENRQERTKTRGKKINELDRFKLPLKVKEEKTNGKFKDLLKFKDTTSDIRGGNTWKRTKETRQRKSRNHIDEAMEQILLMNTDCEMHDKISNSLLKDKCSLLTEKRRTKRVDRKS